MNDPIPWWLPLFIAFVVLVCLLVHYVSVFFTDDEDEA
jgi:hypothetical protein